MRLIQRGLLLLVGNDSVPISMWPGGSIRCTEFPCVTLRKIFLVSFFFYRRAFGTLYDTTIREYTPTAKILT